MEKAVLGGGCFWCLEAVFPKLKGVIRVVPGYAGGHSLQPDYHQVCSGETGHAEVVQVEYDPQLINYRQLLEVFFFIHDPTTLNRQGNDVGSQYRSIILTLSPEQMQQAGDYINQLKKEKTFSRDLVTEIKPLETFYPAEKYHHQYFLNNFSQPYCQAVVGPKVDKFLKRFEAWLK
ncbi:MAG: peptide-methionine (S)-S-oxide reductase MsrA [Actinomycetota bacterium]|nr:peptide-methionine (S)-S-oxide reductase MsrA [Actinomycetota bacterium]